jgi:hypothetical protein
MLIPGLFFVCSNLYIVSLISVTVIKIKETMVISSWMLNEKNMHLIIIS